MDPIYQQPFHFEYKEEFEWPLTSSAGPQPAWSQAEIMPDYGSGFLYAPQQPAYRIVNPVQLIDSVSNSHTPKASPMLTAQPSASTCLPNYQSMTKLESNYLSHPSYYVNQDVSVQSRPASLPTPTTTPSPIIRPMTEQPGSINALMKEIQATSQTPVKSSSAGRSHPGSTLKHLVSHQRSSSQPGSLGREKKHSCPHQDCGKTFSQKTHLDIHLRSHSGLKPFECPYPSCPSRFTQLGNLKTHIRRHTGERPFSCDLCPKKFAQRGNVRSHRATVHASQEEKQMFECRLQGCGKLFSQRGNLKGHMERFHAEAIGELTTRFAEIGRTGEENLRYLSREEKELWAYFGELYKNSNKGIKGRGKDRKIEAVSAADHSHMTAMVTSGNFSPLSQASVTASTKSGESSSSSAAIPVRRRR